MDIRVGIPDEEDPEPLLSFHSWLMDDRDIRSQARITLVETPGRPGDMTPGIALISLLVSSGFNIAGLGMAIANWRASRKAPPPVRIEVGGVRIVVDDSGWTIREDDTPDDDTPEDGQG
ncbi:effector-associated constant component EACC1 [Streptomyces syringium]|uniref:effector-associated constant component EACC1 n=1 Tax=Streptomyces syringium TaxID=76729 RepID=UPI003D8A1ED0